MSLSAVYILDAKGKVLINRDFRGDVPSNCVERFVSFISEAESEADVKPIIYEDGITYSYIQYNNVYLLAISRTNVNCMSTLYFLHRLVDVFKFYFQELEEESLRDNFVIVYELFDEVMDFGYPQFTEAKIMSEYIKTDAHKMAAKDVHQSMAVTNAVSWRAEGIKYSKNEVFLDVTESISLVVNSAGQVVHSEVTGALKMRCQLSGMPECKLGLNDKAMLEAQGKGGKGKSVELEDMKFHQCVRLSRFDTDRTISFIPPDGAFDLMTYRVNTPIKPLVWIEAVQEKTSSRVEYMVKIKGNFKERSQATGVEVKLPVSADATNPVVRASVGAATYAPEQEALLWKIKTLPGGKEYILRAKFSLPSVGADEEGTRVKRPPIQVKFEIPYYVVSGIQVRYLKVLEKSGYQALPWVRYITKSGKDYDFRLQ